MTTSHDRDDAWYRRADALLDAALDLEAAEQEDFVTRQCGEDTALRDEVLALLRAHHTSEGFIEAVHAPLAALIANDLSIPKSAPGSKGGDDITQAERSVGPYRLLRELGRGGMAVVYLAERADGQYRRQVAVKILRSGADSEELRRRLLAERQILASLSHPNIAALLDGGVTEGERPYLVLEYVDGVPITTYCDRRGLDVESRLRLFQDVCAAVQHAHQNLVLHRDLKPGNVLVTSDGRVKLLDFGIAKLLNPNLTSIDQPITRAGLRVMTPAYASPEQVQGLPLTTASDVYALGLLLYELLVGAPAHRIDADTPQGVVAAVIGREPERPSLRAAAHDDAAATAAAARDTTPERLARRLRGDLDAIIELALRKEPSRRYGSAELFADDVRRHLDGLTVMAHRGTKTYRLEKFLRRHRTAALGVAASVALLLGGTAVALKLAADAARQRDRATTALAQTRRTLAESEAVTDFLVGLFEASDPTEGRADTLTARDLLRRGLARADRLSDEPLAQARMLEALGRVHANREELALGADLLRRALFLRREALGAEHPLTASTEADLSDVLRAKGDFAAADTLAREALRVRQATLGETHADVAASLRQLSSLAVYFGDLRVAELYQRQAVDVDRRGGAGRDSALARDLEQLGGLLRRRGDSPGAEGVVREALAVANRTFGKAHRDRAFIEMRLADVLEDWPAGRAEAESLYRAALDEMRAAFGDAHPETAAAMEQLGEVLVRHGEREEGEALVRHALETEQRTLGPSNGAVASTMLTLSYIVGHDRYSPDAEALARDATAMIAKTYGERHTVYGGALAALAEVVAKRGALDSAETLYRRAIVIRRAAAAGPRNAVPALTGVNLARLLMHRGRFDESDSLYRYAIASLSSFASPQNYTLRKLYALLAEEHAARGWRDSANVYRQRAAGADPNWR